MYDSYAGMEGNNFFADTQIVMLVKNPLWNNGIVFVYRSSDWVSGGSWWRLGKRMEFVCLCGQFETESSLAWR